MGNSGTAAPFLTPALDGGEWLTSRTFRFTPQERTPLRIGQEAGWALEPVWAFWRREKSLFLAGIRTPDLPTRSLSAINGIK